MLLAMTGVTINAGLNLLSTAVWYKQCVIFCVQAFCVLAIRSQGVLNCFTQRYTSSDIFKFFDQETPFYSLGKLIVFMPNTDRFIPS